MNWLLLAAAVVYGWLSLRRPSNVFTSVVNMGVVVGLVVGSWMV